MIPTPDEVAALVKKLRRLGLCDPACHGRCRECPQTVADKAAAALESLSPPAGMDTAERLLRKIQDTGLLYQHNLELDAEVANFLAQPEPTMSAEEVGRRAQKSWTG